jgi:hypothetical protein
MGRHWASAGDVHGARALFADAEAVDPEGPIGRAAQAETALLG